MSATGGPPGAGFAPDDVILSAWRPRRRGALPSFLASLTLHAAIVAAAWAVNPRPSPRPFPEPTLSEVLDSADREVVWYAPRRPLPAVSPEKKIPGDAERPRYKAPQNITVADPTAVDSRQMIIGEAPEIPIPVELDLPNIISWEAPAVPRPRFQLSVARQAAPTTAALRAEAAPSVSEQVEAGAALNLVETPKLRYFIKRERSEAPQRQALRAEAAPEVRAASAMPAAAIAPPEDPPKLRYQQRAADASAPEGRALTPEAAPVIRLEASAAGVDLGETLPIARLRYRSGLGGAPRPHSEIAPLGGGEEAPAIGPADGLATAGGAATAAAVVGGSYSAPPPPPGLGAGGDQAGGTGAGPNLAVVGANPGSRLPDQIPKGSRGGRFSAGPDAGPDGGLVGADPNEAAALRSPGLSIEGPPAARSGGPESFKNELARLTRPGGLNDLRRLPAPEIAPEIEPYAPPADLDRPFVGRPVYEVAISMPNITSYRGDWSIQFALERRESDKKSADEDDEPEDLDSRFAKRDKSLIAPSPRVKVDPKYVADAAREGVQGEVVIYAVIHSSGEVTHMQVVKSLDERLDAAAREALRKWVFEPARRFGRPVTVEALVRIPFRLDPTIKLRY